MDADFSHETYPGMRQFATVLFSKTPASKRAELSRKLKIILENAKAQGVATKMDWSKQDIDTLSERFLAKGPRETSNAAFKRSSMQLQSPPRKRVTAASAASSPSSHNTPKPNSRNWQGERHSSPAAGGRSSSNEASPNAAASARRRTQGSGSTQHPSNSPSQGRGVAISDVADSVSNSPVYEPPLSPARSPVRDSLAAVEQPPPSFSASSPSFPVPPFWPPFGFAFPPIGEAPFNGPKGNQRTGNVRQSKQKPPANGARKAAAKGSAAAASSTKGTLESAAPKANAKTSLMRQERFQSNVAASPYVDHQITDTIVGTSTAIEKPYFRLTGQVNPAAVRPPHILEKALAVLTTSPRDASYSYVLDQFKAIRQDLTVQHIQTDLTARVYEANVRIALQNNDLGEVNKCLTQLVHQYTEQPRLHAYRRYEFIAYVVYYNLYTRKWDELGIMLRQSLQVPILRQFEDDDDESGEQGPTLGEFPDSDEQCVRMYARALAVARVFQRQDVFELIEQKRAMYALECSLFNHAFVRVQLQGLKNIFTATSARDQSIPVRKIDLWLGNQSISDTVVLLQTLGIEVSGEQSVEARAALQKLNALPDLNRVDLKGQV